MTTARAFAFTVLLAALFSTGSPNAFAEKLIVGQGGLATIQAAIDQALQNADSVDTVLVPAGSYDESVAIVLTGANAQEKLTLKRKGSSGEVTIVGQASAPALKIDGIEGVEIRNLTLDSGNIVDGVAALEVTGVTLDVNCENVDGVPGDDFGVILSQTSVGVRLTNCDFSGMLGIGLAVDGTAHAIAGGKANGCGLNGLLFAATSLNCRVSGFEAVALGGAPSTDTGVISVRGAGHAFSKTIAGGAGVGGDGFHIEGAGHSFSKCSSTGNGRAGFNLAAETSLSSCDASGNLYGLQGGGTGATVSGGSWDLNSSHGLLLLNSGTHVVNVSANNNTGSGVFVQAGVVGSNVSDSSFKDNGGEAVTVAGDFTWLEGNSGKKGDGFVDQGANNGGRDNLSKGGGQNDF